MLTQFYGPILHDLYKLESSLTKGVVKQDLVFLAECF